MLIKLTNFDMWYKEQGRCRRTVSLSHETSKSVSTTAAKQHLESEVVEGLFDSGDQGHQKTFEFPKIVAEALPLWGYHRGHWL